MKGLAVDIGVTFDAIDPVVISISRLYFSKFCAWACAYSSFHFSLLSVLFFPSNCRRPASEAGKPTWAVSCSDTLAWNRLTAGRMYYARVGEWYARPRTTQPSTGWAADTLFFQSASSLDQYEPMDQADEEAKEDGTATVYDSSEWIQVHGSGRNAFLAANKKTTSPPSSSPSYNSTNSTKNTTTTKIPTNSSTKKSTDFPLWSIGVIAGAVVVFIAVALIIFCVCRRRQKKAEETHAMATRVRPSSKHNGRPADGAVGALPQPAENKNPAKKPTRSAPASAQVDSDDCNTFSMFSSSSSDDDRTSNGGVPQLPSICVALLSESDPAPGRKKTSAGRQKTTAQKEKGNAPSPTSSDNRPLRHNMYSFMNQFNTMFLDEDDSCSSVVVPHDSHPVANPLAKDPPGDSPRHTSRHPKKQSSLPCRVSRHHILEASGKEKRASRKDVAEVEVIDLMDPNRKLTRGERRRLQQLSKKDTADPDFGVFIDMDDRDIAE